MAKRGRKPQVPTCHPDQRHQGLGLCRSCYDKQRAPNKVKARCHPDQPHVARGLCTRCYYDRPEIRAAGRKASRRWEKNNPDRMKEYYRRYRKAKYAYHLAYLRKRRDAKYGVTLEALLSEQAGECGICRTTTPTRCFVVDHDHATGQVRGALCSRCNAAIGALGDTADGLEQAITYLKRQRAGIEA